MGDDRLVVTMRYYAFACACSSSTSSVALLLYSKPFFSFSVNAYKKTPLVYPPKVTYNRQKASQSASFCARQKRSFQHSVSRFLSLFFFAPLKRVARTYVRYRTKRERERERNSIPRDKKISEGTPPGKDQIGDTLSALLLRLERVVLRRRTTRTRTRTSSSE